MRDLQTASSNGEVDMDELMSKAHSITTRHEALKTRVATARAEQAAVAQHEEALRVALEKLAEVDGAL